MRPHVQMQRALAILFFSLMIACIVALAHGNIDLAFVLLVAALSVAGVGAWHEQRGRKER